MWTAAVLLLLASSPGAPLPAQRLVELPAEDRPLAPGMQPVYAVGALDGAAWETFGEIAGVAFDGVGNLHVLDRQAGHVVVVSPEGGFLRRVGSPGEGPGEFRRPVAMAVDRAGEVTVFDGGHMALLVFGSDGGFLRQLPLDPTGALPGSRIVADGRGGVVSASGQGFAVFTRGPEGAPGPPPGVPIVRYDLADGGAEVLHMAWAPSRPGASAAPGAGGVITFPARRGFEPRFHFGVIPGGAVAFVDSVTYRVRVVGADGRHRLDVVRGVDPAPVTERHRERERARLLAELEEGGGPRIRIETREGSGGARRVPQASIREALERQILEMQFADVHPVVRRLAVDWDGTLWLERTGDDPSAPGPVDIFTAGGSYRGTLSPGDPGVPDAFGPGGLVAYVERSELDVPRVVVSRVSGTGR